MNIRKLHIYVGIFSSILFAQFSTGLELIAICTESRTPDYPVTVVVNDGWKKATAKHFFGIMESRGNVDLDCKGVNPPHTPFACEVKNIDFPGFINADVTFTVADQNNMLLSVFPRNAIGELTRGLAIFTCKTQAKYLD